MAIVDRLKKYHQNKDLIGMLSVMLTESRAKHIVSGESGEDWYKYLALQFAIDTILLYRNRMRDVEGLVFQEVED